MSWNILGDSFTKLLEHLDSNQKRTQAMIDTLAAVAQAQQAYSVRLQGIAEQHEKKYLGYEIIYEDNKVYHRNKYIIYNYENL